MPEERRKEGLAGKISLWAMARQAGKNQVFNIKKETMVIFSSPLPSTFSLSTSTATRPSRSSNSRIAIAVKYSRSSPSSRSKSFCRLLPIMREIWWRVRKPFSLELMPFRIAVSFSSGVFRSEMLMILMNCSQLMKSPKQQMFRISSSPGFMSRPFSPASNVSRSIPRASTASAAGVRAWRRRETFSNDLQRLQRLQTSNRFSPYFSSRQGMFCVLSRLFLRSRHCSRSFFPIARSVPPTTPLRASFAELGAVYRLTSYIMRSSRAGTNLWRLLVLSMASSFWLAAASNFLLTISLGKWVFDSKSGFLFAYLAILAVDCSSEVYLSLYQLVSSLCFSLLGFSIFCAGFSEIRSTYSCTFVILCQSQSPPSPSPSAPSSLPTSSFSLILEERSKICWICWACSPILVSSSLSKLSLGELSMSSTSGLRLSISAKLWTGEPSGKKKQSSRSMPENSFTCRRTCSPSAPNSCPCEDRPQGHHSAKLWTSLYRRPVLRAERTAMTALLPIWASTILPTRASLSARRFTLGTESWCSLALRQRKGCRPRRSVLLPEAAVEAARTRSLRLKPSRILKEETARSFLGSSLSKLFFSLQLRRGAGSGASSCGARGRCVSQCQRIGSSCLVCPWMSTNLASLLLLACRRDLFMAVTYKIIIINSAIPSSAFTCIPYIPCIPLSTPLPPSPPSLSALPLPPPCPRAIINITADVER